MEILKVRLWPKDFGHFFNFIVSIFQMDLKKKDQIQKQMILIFDTFHHSFEFKSFFFGRQL